MGLLERIADLRNQPLSQVIFNIQKWSDETERITFEIDDHPRCESGIWIVVNLYMKNGKRYIIDGSRLDVVKKRLIDHMDRNGIWDSRHEILQKPSVG